MPAQSFREAGEAGLGGNFRAEARSNPYPMKLAGLLVFIPAGLIAVASAEETVTGLASRETKSHIREGLPAYRPTPPKTDAEAGARRP